MMYFEFNAGDKIYKLRLNTRNIVSLEKQINCNPLGIFGTGNRIPTITEMVSILHCSLQQYEHGISFDKAQDIFDEYLNDGNSPTDFIKVIIEIYKVSGIIKESETGEKN